MNFILWIIVPLANWRNCLRLRMACKDSAQIPNFRGRPYSKPTLCLCKNRAKSNGTTIASKQESYLLEWHDVCIMQAMP